MLKENLEKVEENIQAACDRAGRKRDEVTLIAVSKTKPVEMLQEAYDLGVRINGENKAQELLLKQEVMPKDIQWHFIGHLQSNKVKTIAPFIHTIHSIDSAKLLQEVDKQAARFNRTIRVLLQIYIAREDTKFGLSFEECIELLESGLIADCKHVEVCGLMGMATNTDDTGLIREEFRKIHDLFIELKETLCKDNVDFKEISMGMSHDYPIAIQEGSTLIRVGTSIFGEREY